MELPPKLKRNNNKIKGRKKEKKRGQKCRIHTLGVLVYDRSGGR